MEMGGRGGGGRGMEKKNNKPRVFVMVRVLVI